MTSGRGEQRYGRINGGGDQRGTRGGPEGDQQPEGNQRVTRGGPEGDQRGTSDQRGTRGGPEGGDVHLPATDPLKMPGHASNVWPLPTLRRTNPIRAVRLWQTGGSSHHAHATNDLYRPSEPI